MKTTYKVNVLAIGWVCTLFVFVLSAFAFVNAQTTAIVIQMSPGDSGAQVSALQTFLAADSTVYPEGLVTGYYGALTMAAVERYQCKNGIVCSGDPASTGYGRVGPLTLAKIQSQGGGTVGGGVVPSFDVNAPILSTPAVTVASNAATVHWTTNEPARSRVLYATYRPALTYDAFASLSSFADPTFDFSSDVTLIGLMPNTIYYYVLESVDGNGNLQWGIDHSFRTNP
ncbi:hypothetical protein A3D71_02775 [Candidatus Kaiserbacteria bacterium RIFCSPHIGHO2_02_FULL_55_20]|uniref:Fibronectin type-III domain-containing protein n=1 Tax=Candidatus Kaiserbacteria bacterium RIFCSPHIGHO2_02_FULL_55_20 TaxID=1798497 RepID=A0A1F6DYZ9_9BACT|nr:MAG: hypothetical protein A2680_00115 [Candidatus Kaiserbacteria bacterium RIFCSPHIGHO2_01_FULL_55_37]OGG66557.1 MAG: hypothetical protein A3D71_02775 [Candidatus Kaiserbacteria bacterium RIFCSPHIGHO2_02_FULL_55_20]